MNHVLARAVGAAALAGIIGTSAPALAGGAEADAFVKDAIGKQTQINIPPQDKLGFVMDANGGFIAQGWGPQLCAGPQQGFWRVEAGQLCLVVAWFNQCFDVSRDANGYILSAKGFPATPAPMSFSTIEPCV